VNANEENIKTTQDLLKDNKRAKEDLHTVKQSYTYLNPSESIREEIRTTMTMTKTKSTRQEKSQDTQSYSK